MSKGTRLSTNKQALESLHKFASDGWGDSKIQLALEQEFGHSWSIQSIRRNRKKMGIVKNKGETINNDTKDKPILSIPPPGLDDHEKASWFRQQFKKSHLYKELKGQFHPKEISIYMEEYGSVCCQFEDIVTSEFFQIDDYLKHRILINRQLKLMKDLEIDIATIKKWIADNPFEKDELTWQQYGFWLEIFINPFPKMIMMH